MTPISADDGLIEPDHKPERAARARDALTLPPSSRQLRFENHDRRKDYERQVLLKLGVPEETVSALECEAAHARVGLADVAIAKGVFRADAFYEALARHYAFHGGQRIALPQSVHGNERSQIVLQEGCDEPWRLLSEPQVLSIEPGGFAGVNAEAMPLEALAMLSRVLGERRRKVQLLTRRSLLSAIGRRHGGLLVQNAIWGLLRKEAKWSAKYGLVTWQALFCAACVGLFLGVLVIYPRQAMLGAALLLSAFFALAISLRFAAALYGLAKGKVPPKVKQAPPELLADCDLPRYSVLVPLYQEAQVLPHLVRALTALDYPAAKLDIKLVLERSDFETIAAARAFPRPGNVDILIVPNRGPRTKPKALNYALQFVTGEFVAVFDAEDRPEPDQLRKAATRFACAPRHLACLQASLDYFNARENWLSRQFTIEYAALFRGILPLLSRFGLPMPLGGTSNHFRTEVLRELGGWDAFNVTEDADLGMRLHRAGYKIATLESVTYEEACCQPGAWLKQRTRWLKGWMQTFGVHMRSPFKTLRQTGFWGFLAFQAYFAGMIVSALVHPIFYAVIVVDGVQGTLLSPASTAFEQAFRWVALANFAGGYGANLLLACGSLRRTRHKGLVWSVVYIPFYWLMISVAAYRAVWQLVRKPFLWEKTAHGVSKHVEKE